MIRNRYLNEIKEGLETYFEYEPKGPKSIALDYDHAKALLNFLQGLDEFRVSHIIPRHMIEMFPEDEITGYVKNVMAGKIADELVKNHYVTFETTTEIDPINIYNKKVMADLIVVKRSENEETNNDNHE